MIINPEMLPGVFWKTARAMAVYSGRAYRDHTICDPATGAQALITTNEDGDIIVAFKGSSTARDFIEDARVLRDTIMEVGGKKVEVHSGFHDDFKAVNAAVVSSVRQLSNANRAAQIFITGHSLGGALALLCALEFSRQNLMPAGVFTFGQPRVGNAAFAALYDAGGGGVMQPYLRDITYRIVNQNDIVPRLPGLLAGYRHCGQEVWIEPKPYGNWELNPSWLTKCVYDAIGLYAAYRRMENVLINEHFIAAYRERIDRL